ncbi:MAG: acyltransferase [Burkholderiaceae bacterium]|nr:acyltransferase [Microbacteriaceae bacterium]
MTAETTDRPERLLALDALRGVAAVVVLVHHVSMTIPAVSAAYESSANVAFLSTGWWVTLSPLKILFAGPEFVLVFFVLSGLVLVRSPLAGGASRRYDWFAYYPRRIIRLGIPVVVSVVLAAAWIALVPRTGGGGAWLAKQAAPDIGIGNILREASLLTEIGRPVINPPLWSLAWEMWFSLLLPIAVILAAATTRRWPVWAALLCATSSLGYLTATPPLMYLPAFALGGLLAANYASLATSAARLSEKSWGTAAWTGLLVAGPLLLVAYWLLRPLLSAPWNDVALSLRVPGAVLIVAVVAFWPPLHRVLSARPVVWLGTLSFSLYLVHFPIVVTFAELAGPGRWWLGALVSVPVSLLAAWLMLRWVERPSLALASRVGRAVGSRTADQQATPR